MHIVSADPLGEMLALLRQFKPPPGLTDGDVARGCIAAHRMGHAAGRAEAIAEVVADLRQGAADARAEPDNVFALTIAFALDAAADRYERGAHLPAKAKEETK
jgi:hypothetical protein